MPANTPLKDNTGQKIYDTKNKTELFANSMERQFIANPGKDLPEIRQSIREINDIKSKSNLFTTPGEVWSIIKKLPSAKAPGHDNIPNKALKHLSTNFIIRLSNLFTACLRHSYFPSSWKTALIVMIPKPHKDHSLPINHRPISLLNTISKVFEKILLTFLKKYIRPREEQHAFRHGHSTTTQLTKLIDDLVCNTNNNKHTAAIFLDMEKAFDRVWHDGLIHKLNTMTNTPKHLIKIIQSFLSNRKFNIKISDTLSSARKIEAGVPQGSCLSPLLYIQYINDLPSTPHVSISLFADDTMFYSSNTAKNIAIIRLQRQTNVANDWIKKWRLKLNTQKTVTILFGTSQKTPKRRIEIDDQKINWKSRAKYLGVTLDKKLRLNEHAITIQKAKRARAALYPVLNRKSPIPLPTRIALYKIYIRPIIMYAITAWGPLLCKSNWNKLEAVQNIAVRTMTGAHYLTRNKTVLTSANINTLREEAKRAANIFYHRNTQSTFAHIRNIGRTKGYNITNRRPRPISILD